MKTCALCQKNHETLKANTHYLTDAIFRASLNENGSQKRDKGASFDISSNTLFSSFSFQRGTSAQKIEEILGKPATDEEIENNIGTPDFSVDNVFCVGCESRFTEIENAFCSQLLQRFRGNQTLKTESEMLIKETGLFRLFWLMQIWRTHVCVERFPLSDKVAEDLRQLIYNGLPTDDVRVKQYPLSLTFMYTGDDPLENTFNGTGYAEGNNPNLILMNEFVVQFFESPAEVRFESFYGLNKQNTFHSFFNVSESEFRIRILSDQQRREFLSSYHSQGVVGNRTTSYYKIFHEAWVSVTGRVPYYWLWQLFFWELTAFDHLPEAQKLTPERLDTCLNNFIIRYKSYLI
jgi:hypothetical protein